MFLFPVKTSYGRSAWVKLLITMSTAALLSRQAMTWMTVACAFVKSRYVICATDVLGGSICVLAPFPVPYRLGC